MQTVDFIYNHIPRLGYATFPDRQCSSVSYWGGVLYSYGHHYPLMFYVQARDGNRVLFVNTSGYSNTTAKHINWAFSAAYRAGVVTHAINLRGNSCHGAVSFEPAQGISNREYIADCLKNELSAIAKRYIGLRANAHRMESTLRERAEDIIDTLVALGYVKEADKEADIKTALLVHAAEKGLVSAAK